VELVTGSEVHPYHLLRYDRAIFTQPAIEKLQVSSEERSLSKRDKAEAGRRRSRKRRRRVHAAAPGAAR
jgi:hypothetical protein